MSSHTLANSPAALAAALAAGAAAAGWVAAGALRVGASLALFTFVSVLLCQYRGCCGATKASTAYFLARMCSVGGRFFRFWEGGLVQARWLPGRPFATPRAP
jgi:hypothetical protein